jgi:hypothetical protein
MGHPYHEVTHLANQKRPGAAAPVRRPSLVVARIISGEVCAREEFPILLEPGDDPFLDETARQWEDSVLILQQKIICLRIFVIIYVYV